MKNKSLLLILVLLAFSCDNTESKEIQEITNKVVLLKVDFTTNVFEGGKELEFSQNSNFSISTTYNSPGDFGDIQLYYDELNEKIFDGTIIWMATGEMTYPSELDSPNTFQTINSNLPLPNTNMFEVIMYDEFAYYPEPINYSNIWNAINNLAVVNQYQNSNPNVKINLFLYTPSIGIGNPVEWDWYVILKN